MASSSERTGSSHLTLGYESSLKRGCSDHAARIAAKQNSKPQTEESVQSFLKDMSFNSERMSLPHPTKRRPWYDDTSGLEFSKREAKAAYKFFEIPSRDLSKDPITFAERFGKMKRIVHDRYCEVFPNYPELNQFNYEVMKCSILIKGFNAKYAKFSKYLYQACTANEWWIPPQDVDFDYINHHLGIDSYDSFKKKYIPQIKKLPCPDFYVRPELLFPWMDERPEAIEILDEENPVECPLTYNQFARTMSKIIGPTEQIPTLIDFVAQQCNTNRIVKEKTLNAAIKTAKKGKKTTGFKYVEVSKWIDEGAPSTEQFAVRTPVWKRPTEYRDAVTCSPTLLWNVWRFGQIIGHSLKDPYKEQYRSITSDSWRGVHKLGLKPEYNYVHCDFKKSGLTMPHWFIRYLLRFLQDENPDIEIDFPVDGWPIYDPVKDRVFRPSDSGYALGMVNEPFTLWNFFISEIGKEEGILSEDDITLSFNDDSVLVTQASQGQVFDIHYRLGSWLDTSKSYTSNTGIQFLEVYNNKRFLTNFKMRSWLNTFTQSIMKSYNYTHCRHIVTQTWRSSGRDFSLEEEGVIFHEYFFMVAREAIASTIQWYWGTKVHFGDPMLGFYNVDIDKIPGYLDVKVSNALVEYMAMEGRERSYAYTCFHLQKKVIDGGMKFRPWEEFPEGPTKRTFQILGKFGFYRGLEGLSNKAKQKFVFDRLEYLKNIYGRLESRLINTLKKPFYDLTKSWDWIQSQDWSSYNIPEELVSEWSEPVTNLYWSFTEDEPPVRYTVLAQLVGLISLVTGNFSTGLDINDIDLSNQYRIWIPLIENNKRVLPAKGWYELLCQLMGHVNYVEQVNRLVKSKGKIPLGFMYKNTFKNEMIKFMNRLYGSTTAPDGSNWVGVTWWTRTPMRYTEDQFKVISNYQPQVTESILENWWVKDLPQYVTEDGLFIFDRVDGPWGHIKYWDERLKSQQLSIYSGPNDTVEERVTSDAEFDEFYNRVRLEDLESANFATMALDEMPFAIEMDEEPGDILVNLSTEVGDLPQVPSWLVQPDSSGEETDWEFEEEDENTLALQFQ